MKDSIMNMLSRFRKRLPWMRPEERTIDTLTAFVRDAEHDVLTVVTALQAHVDLLRDEQERLHLPVIRFAVLNRAIARIITDITALAAFSELALTPPSQQKQLLEGLMQEITKETQGAFNSSQVALSCNIAAGTTLIGSAAALKAMITGMVLAVLGKCHQFETVRIVGLTHKRQVCLSFDSGDAAEKGMFKPWKLGELHLSPTNGEGVSLAAIEAMARIHHGQLTVRTLSDQRHGYRLIFEV